MIKIEVNTNKLLEIHLPVHLLIDGKGGSDEENGIHDEDGTREERSSGGKDAGGTGGIALEMQMDSFQITC